MWGYFWDMRFLFFHALGDAGKQKKDIEIQNYEVQTPEERGQMRQHTRVEVEVRQSCTLPLLKSEEVVFTGSKIRADVLYLE